MMLNTVSRIALSLALVASVAVTAPAFAAAKQTVSPAVGKPLQEAVNLLKGGKTKEAAEKAKEGAAAAKSPFEIYTANQILINVCLKGTDYGCAAKAVQASIDSGAMPPEERPQHLKILAQVHYTTKNYAQAAQAGAQLLKETPNDADVQVLVAQSYYLQKDFKSASNAVRGIVRSSDAAGRPVKEEMLNLLMSSEYEQKNEAGVESALEMLAVRYPKPQYIKDLISTKERNLRGGSTKTSLDVALLKYTVGVFSTPRDYTDLTELALQDGLPGLAKQVMEKGNAEGVLGKEPTTKDREARLLNMATTQAAADQKNLEAGEAEAAKQKTGDALVKFGEAYLSYGMHDKAIAATEAGIAKGVTNADDAKLRLGIAYQVAGQKAKANEAFKGITPGSVPAQIASLWKLAK
jgi:hypothetical protein